jgi:hypothetical protein
MKYGVIVSVFAILLVSATLVNSVEAFRPNTNQVPNDAPVSNPNTNQVPNDAPVSNPNTNQVPNDAPVSNPNTNQVTVMGSSPYYDSAGHYNIIGEVKNNGFSTSRFIKVTAAIHDSSNRIIDTASAYTSLDELKSQETSNFHIVFSNQAPIDESGTYTLTISSSPSSGQTTTSKPPVLRVNYGNVRVDSPDTFTILGEVTNMGNQPADSVKVSTSFYDAGNQLVDVENVYPQLSTLQPGQSAPFEIVVSKSSNPLLAQIDSASFNVQSRQYSSVSMGEKVVVGPALNNAVTGTSPSTTYVYGGFTCGKDTHLNKKGQCIPDDKCFSVLIERVADTGTGGTGTGGTGTGGTGTGGTGTGGTGTGGTGTGTGGTGTGTGGTGTGTGGTGTGGTGGTGTEEKPKKGDRSC